MRITLAAALTLIICANLFAVAPPSIPPESKGDEVQDVLFLGPTRPALWRLKIRMDGKPFTARWEAQMARLFRHLDRNDDGQLDRDEITRAPSAAQLQMFFQGNFYNNISGSIPFDDIDANSDGKVTLEEFTRYYQRGPAGPVTQSNGSAFAGRGLGGGFDYAGGGGTDSISTTLFEALDTNKDGKLSKEELAAAVTVLRKFDQNDDELISAQELVGLGAGYPFYAGQFPTVQSGSSGPGVRLLMVEKPSAAKRLTGRLNLAREIIKAYDRDKDDKLSPSEIALPKDLFAKLDTNRDGKLDALEILRWTTGQPEEEVLVNVGNSGAGMMTPGGRTAVAMGGPLGASMPVKTIKLEGSQVAVMALPNYAVTQAAGINTYFLNLFKQIDTDKKGFITRKQLELPQYTYLRPLAEQADRDGDGKVTEKELTSYLELLNKGVGCQISLSLQETGQGLFQMLDANGDGQLSIRELRNAWSRVADLDKDGDGCISKAEFPRQFQLTVSQGNAFGYAFATVGTMPRFGMPTNPPQRGPVWFRKMDRNGDGDVSRAEWLGTDEDFRKIDKNGDGLISLEEAEKADADLRKANKAEDKE